LASLRGFKEPEVVPSVMPRIEVVRSKELKAGDATDGIARGRAFEDDAAIVSRTRVAAGVRSAWHHHGSRLLYGFLAAGRFRLEYGPDGKEAADLEPGDFFRIPVGLVHRDVNPDSTQEVVVVSVVVGRGPAVVNVRGP
jgi:quercetin dioxygenase-like cupin family protein